MNPLKCIIVDDEPLAVRLIQSFVERTPSLELLSAHTDPVEALEAIQSGEANLVFLDIQMPDIDGMDWHAPSLPPHASSSPRHSRNMPSRVTRCRHLISYSSPFVM